MDYSKPTAQMLGRWQPFHDGHLALFKEILKKTGQVVIMVRSMPQTENNPFVFEDIKKRIEEKRRNRILLSKIKNKTRNRINYYMAIRLDTYT